MKKRIAALLLVVVGVFALSACDDSSNSQKESQYITEQYSKAATEAVPYPLSAVTSGGWLERTLLVENLLRQNNKDRVAYVTLLSQQGQPIAEYTIQGMVFSLNSELTTPDRTNDCGDSCGAVTEAPGDNGTYGPEPDGIGFFTTSGVEIKWNGLYVESDAPQNITAKPVIVYDATAKPSVNAGHVGAVTP